MVSCQIVPAFYVLGNVIQHYRQRDAHCMPTIGSCVRFGRAERIPFSTGTHEFAARLVLR